MNSKRSIWKLLVGVAGVGLLVTNCTVKSDDGCTEGNNKNGCECPGSAVGHQTCLADGTYGACICPSGNEGGASNGGATSAGATNGGASVGGAMSSSGSGGEVSSAGASEAGAGGEGGIVVDPLDCYDCLTKLCATEWSDCAAEDETHPFDPSVPTAYCLSSDGTNPGQIELIMDCITAERAKGLAKRDAVRGCGASLGGNSNPANFKWPPDEMTPVTEQLMNCMADAPDEMIPGTWADPSNFPNDVPAPWAAGTCAKLSCTSDLSGQ